MKTYYYSVFNNNGQAAHFGQVMATDISVAFLKAHLKIKKELGSIWAQDFDITSWDGKVTF